MSTLISSTARAGWLGLAGPIGRRTVAAAVPLLAAGALVAGCGSAHTFPQVGTFTADFGNAPLLVSSGAVDVLDARFNGNEQKQLWTSANAFATPSVVASMRYPSAICRSSVTARSPSRKERSSSPMVATNSRHAVVDSCVMR